MNRANFLKGALASSAALGLGWAALERGEAREPSDPLGPDKQGRPRLVIGSARIDPAASEVHVEVRLTGPVLHTVLVQLVTRNGSDLLPPKNALEGVHYSSVRPYVTFRPGDDPVQVVTIPLTGRARAGQWFELIVPNDVQGAEAANAIGRIVFEPGARTVAKPYKRRAQATPRKGKQTFELDIANFRATDEGKGVWRTRFKSGRTQPANNELGLYTDPVLHPGTRSWEVRDNLLFLRAEKLATPILHPRDGQTYKYSASVLTAETLNNQLYGYYEWDVRATSARGTWCALWLLPSDGSWPPEIDVMETPRNGQYGPGDTNVAMHWGPPPPGRKAAGARIQLAKLLGRPIDLTRDFHRHGVDWRADYTTWYVDGQEVWQAPTHFHKPAFPLMDVAVGGWGGAPDFSTGTTEMAIRSLKVWA